MPQSDIIDFLRLHRYAVEASTCADGSPQAALVAFVANSRLQLFFDSFDSTRKTINLRRDPRVAFVIGGHTTGDERTVQYEGFVDTPTGAELEEFKREYFTAHPDGLRRSRLPGITYFRVCPRWLRYTDLNVTPPTIITLEGIAAEGPQDNPLERAPAHGPAEVSAAWQPQMDVKSVFNPFVSPQNRTTGDGG